jgi:hypothetical protein
MLQANIRTDAHSSFGSNNRWGTFYGIMTAWRFSNEPWMKSVSWLGESMIRFSYGISGRQPDDVYARFATYESTSSGAYIKSPAIAPTKIQLNNLRWETINSWNIGGDFNLFKDKLYLEGDIYNKVSTDLLFNNYDIPYSSGFERLRYLNGGEMTNYGWELMGDWKAYRNQDWLVSVNFNISQNINSFNKLPDNFNSERAISFEGC